MKAMQPDDIQSAPFALRHDAPAVRGMDVVAIGPVQDGWRS